jgi:hypothetical protein
MQHLLLFHYNSSRMNARQCYVIRTLGFRQGEVEVLLLREMRPRNWVIGTNHAIGTKCTVTPYGALEHSDIETGYIINVCVGNCQ